MYKGAISDCDATKRSARRCSSSSDAFCCVVFLLLGRVMQADLSPYRLGRWSAGMGCQDALLYRSMDVLCRVIFCIDNRRVLVGHLFNFALRMDETFDLCLSVLEKAFFFFVIFLKWFSNKKWHGKCVVALF